MKHTIVDLVKNVAELNGIPETKAREIIGQFLGMIQAAMRNGDSVQIRDFGTFEVRVNKAGLRRNIKAGTTFHKEETARPHFKFSPTVKKFINKK